MSTTTSRIGSFYDEKLAASQLRKYREEGPSASTQALIDALMAEGVEGATLLDIGGGIGAIQHELLAAGAAHATCVDASAYLEAARDESSRRGLGALGSALPTSLRPRVPARHADGEARYLRHESHPAPAPQGSARLDPASRRDRADRSSERSQPPPLSERRTGVAGRALPPPMTRRAQAKSDDGRGPRVDQKPTTQRSERRGQHAPLERASATTRAPAVSRRALAHSSSQFVRSSANLCR
jgi:hypothetical protein